MYVGSVDRRNAALVATRRPEAGALARQRAPGAVQAFARDGRSAVAQRWPARPHQHIANAQRAQDFLVQLGMGLVALKRELGVSESAPTLEPGQAEALLRRLDALWRRRIVATGGSLDPQLELSMEGRSRQRFRVRQLDRMAASDSEAEDLLFSGGVPKRDVSIRIGPDASALQQARRWSRALVALGIGVEPEERSFVFSVDEQAWPRLRATLTIAAAGARAPSGHAGFVPEELPPALEPSEWRITDAEAREATRQALAAGLARVRGAKAAVDHALRSARLQVESGGAAYHPVRAAAAVGEIVAQVMAGDYLAHAAAAPAVARISPQRVLSVLGTDRGG